MSEAKKKDYWCINGVRHDGKRYAPKDKVSLTDDEAKPLLSAHAITPHDPAKKAEAEVKAAAEAEAKAKAEAKK